jgi:hypothetical protein
VNCCSIASNPALRQPFQKVSQVEWQTLLVVAPLLHFPVANGGSEFTLFPQETSPLSSGNPFTVLRL